MDFNPRPPRGGRRPCRRPKTAAGMPFQSTPPARGATRRTRLEPEQRPVHFNPRPPRGGRPKFQIFLEVCPIFQSTPPARGATTESAQIKNYMNDFNPRPPRGGRLCDFADKNCVTSVFQSTPPARGATPCEFPNHPRHDYFNPRPPRGGRLGYGLVVVDEVSISIHAPREGGDGQPGNAPDAYC